MLLKVNPCRWGVNNRPAPRAVQVLVVVAIVVPAACAGVAGYAVGQILTVHWPTGGER